MTEVCEETADQDLWAEKPKDRCGARTAKEEAETVASIEEVACYLRLRPNCSRGKCPGKILLTNLSSVSSNGAKVLISLAAESDEEEENVDSPDEEKALEANKESTSTLDCVEAAVEAVR